MVSVGFSQHFQVPSSLKHLLCYKTMEKKLDLTIPVPCWLPVLYWYLFIPLPAVCFLPRTNIWSWSCFLRNLWPIAKTGTSGNPDFGGVLESWMSWISWTLLFFTIDFSAKRSKPQAQRHGGGDQSQCGLGCPESHGPLAHLDPFSSMIYVWFKGDFP